jgi:hypothetical protein
MPVEIKAFWDMPPYHLVGIYQSLGGSATPCSRQTTLFYYEDGGSRFLRNTGKYLPDYMASYPKI